MLLALLLLVGSAALLRAQPASEESVFRLLEAERAEQYEQYGVNFRLVKGHARFLHNDTYLLCDSASWNVDSKVIEAFGNVQVIQDKTMLKSEEMVYWIDESKAVFRGKLVELLDKDGNTLRTERLTYNTKDSVAVFEFGGSMKDKDGNVIESNKGTYDAKEGLFTFEDRVELYMDSIEIKTHVLRYFNDNERAHFGKNTYVWREEGFLRADAGWYDRPNRVVYFADHVFMFDPSYDAWADELYYYQADGAVDMFHNAQVLDSTNKSVYLGDHLQYLPPDTTHSQRGLLTGDPAIIYYGENENHVVDTLYARADTFYVYSVPRASIPEEEVKEAEKRLDDIQFDALSKKRTEEAAVREQERIKKMRDVGLLPPEWVEKQQKATADSLAALAAKAAADSIAALSPAAAPDSLPALTDSLSVAPEPIENSDTTVVAPPVDTLPVRYVLAWNNVKMYRSDLQAACDSAVFCEIDSIARLYGRPVLWNEIRNQLTAEEMHLLFKDGAFSRGSMITDAWLISQQDSIHFNQIKSTEMQGWFRDNKLYRFDALGGVSAIFYMAEEEEVTTINVKESKSLTAAIKDGSAQRLLYMESIKSDAYPVGDLPPEKQQLKGFEWRAAERPATRDSITLRQVRTSERKQYEGMLRPLYRETNKYYDNYMVEVIESAAERRRLAAERRQQERDSIQRVKDSLALAKVVPVPDSLAIEADTLVVSDVPVAIDSTHIVADTLVVTPPLEVVEPLGPTAPVKPAKVPAVDTVLAAPVEKVEIPVEPVRMEATPASPETVVVSEQLTRAEKRALRKAERKARREARRAARLARRKARAAARR
jgi:lipopolysaccharide export system protein LptA